MSININSIASDVEWYGTDFNPSQVVFAKKLAELTHNKCKLYDDSFKEFSERDDLPDFDFIGLHGIWSWINTENQQHIVNFIRKKLKLGGVLYISYNTFPGWSVVAPLRHLFMEYSENIGNQNKGVLGNVQGAIEFVKNFLATEPLYSVYNPSASTKFEKIATQDKQYLAHEYFNRDWNPIYFSDMAKCLSAAKLSYVCSANYLDNINELRFSNQQIEFLKQCTDVNLHETICDFLINQSFRRDYWVKGSNAITPITRNNILKKERIILIVPKENISLQVSRPQGSITLHDNIYGPIIDILSDYQIHTIEELADTCSKKNINFEQLISAIYILRGLNYCTLVQSDNVIKERYSYTKSFNKYIHQKHSEGLHINFNASPVSGAGIAIDVIQQFFLMALANGRKETETSEIAKFAHNMLVNSNLRVKNGDQVIKSPEETSKYLNEQVKLFIEKRLPILKALKIV